MSIKIGLVLSYMPGYSETFFKSKIDGLIENGYKVSLFVDYKAESHAPKEVDIFVAPNLNKVPLKYLNLLFIIIKCLFQTPLQCLKLFKLNAQDGMSIKNNMLNLIKNQFFLKHNLDWFHFGFGMLAVGRENVAKAIGAKMGVSFRGYDLYLSPLKHPGCYDKLFNKQIRYHVLSNGMKKTLLEYGIKDEQISIIPPAIDTDFFNNNIKARSNKPIQILTIARLHWKKGLEYSIQSMRYLKDMGINFHYTIIGEGSERERLVYAIHQLGLREEVSLIGKMNRDQIKQFLSESDIYLQYSIQEGFCNAVLEAQSMGLLCIVSNAEGLDENVLDGETGWVIKKRNPKLLAETIRKVIQIPIEKKLNIKNNACNRVRDNFSIEQQKKSFSDFYK